MGSKKETQRVVEVLAELTLVAGQMAVKDSKKAATAPALAALEKPLEAPLHRDLRALWSWRADPDGILSSAKLGLDLEEPPVWLTPKGAASALKMLRDSELPVTLVPFSADEAGNYFCHDRRTGKVLDWDHETRKASVLSASLAAFLERSLKRAKQSLRDAKAAQAAAAKPAEARTPGALPKKIRPRVNPTLKRLDSKGYAGGIKTAALTPDGKGLVVAHGGVELWDLARKKQLERFGGFHTDAVSMSESGICAIGSASGYASNMTLVEAKTGKLVAYWQSEVIEKSDDKELVRSVNELVLSDDGQWVASGGHEGVSLWKTSELPKTTHVLWSKAPSRGLPFGKKPLSPEPEPDVVRPRLIGPKEAVVDLALSCKTLVVLGKNVVALWSLDTGKQVASAAIELYARAVAISPDGERTVVRAHDGTMILFDAALKVLRQWKGHAEPRDYHANGLWTVRFDPSSSFFVSSGGGELKIWAAADAKPLAQTKVGADKKSVPLIQSVHANQVLTTRPLTYFDLE